MRQDRGLIVKMLQETMVGYKEGRVWGCSVGFWKQYMSVGGYCLGYTRIVASLVPRLSTGRAWERVARIMIMNT